MVGELTAMVRGSSRITRCGKKRERREGGGAQRVGRGCFEAVLERVVSVVVVAEGGDATRISTRERGRWCLCTELSVQVCCR